MTRGRPRIRIASIDWGSRFRALSRSIKNPERPLSRIGALLKSRAKQAFLDQGRPKGAWEPRAVPNIPGILRDYHGGLAKPPKRRFEPRPALRDSGDLHRQINWQFVGRYAIEVGVHGPAHRYASKQQFGLPGETEEVTEGFQQWLWAWLKTREGQPWKEALGWLLNRKFQGKRLPWRPLARPFIVLTSQDVEDIAEECGVQIVKAMAPGGA